MLALMATRVFPFRCFPFCRFPLSKGRLGVRVRIRVRLRLGLELVFRDRVRGYG